MMINMFDIFYADLPKDVTRSEQGGIRPVVIIQNNVGNKYSSTVIVLPITSEIKKISLPTHSIIHKTIQNGLSHDSMVLAEQIRVIDKRRLLNKIGYLDNKNEQSDVIKSYLANVVGKKREPILTEIVDMLFGFIKKEEYKYAA